MAEFFAVSAENLNDALRVDELRAVDAALIEPLACVMKSIRKVAVAPNDRVAVIGLGVMGLMHALALRSQSVPPAGFDINPDRVAWARSLGIHAHEESTGEYDVVIVCPGSEAALQAGLTVAAPEARVVLFAPMPPGAPIPVALNELYFRDISLHNVYSCGPNDTIHAYQQLREGKVRAEHVVSNFIELDALPQAYLSMKRGEILKPMVIFADA